MVTVRVLHINDHLSPRGGVETYLLSLIPRLEDLGAVQGIAYANGDSSLCQNTFCIPELSQCGRKAGFIAVEKLKLALAKFQPDLIHLHSIYNTDAIEFLLDSKPVVLTCHDFRYLCPASNFFHRRTQTVCDSTCGISCFLTTITKKCMTLRPGYSWNYFQRVVRVRRRFADFRHLIAPGMDAALRFQRDGFPSDRMTVLPYFCRIPPAETPRRTPERHNILFLGRLTENKGWEYFLETIARLPSNVHGTVIGSYSDATKGRLEQWLSQTGCRDRVTLRSWASREEIAAQLCQTSVLIFPSLWPETLGIVGLEAMAYGVPVVASDIGGVKEWLVDGETGYLVQPKDAAAIADRVQRILSDSSLAEQMSVAALQRLRSHFLPEHHVPRLMQIYESALLNA